MARRSTPGETAIAPAGGSTADSGRHGVASVKGYNRRELAVVLSIVFQHRRLFLEKSREFCGPIAEE